MTVGRDSAGCEVTTRDSNSVASEVGTGDPQETGWARLQGQWVYGAMLHESQAKVRVVGVQWVTWSTLEKRNLPFLLPPQDDRNGTSSWSSQRTAVSNVVATP